MLGKSQAKYIQSLGQKKLRDQEGMFIAEGPKIVGELLTSAKSHIHKLYALHDWIAEHHSNFKDIDMVEVDETDLQKISQLTTSNNILAIVKKFKIPETIAIKDTVSLVLDTIQDPGNLGTIIRIADWFGIEQIVCSNDCADMYNPKVVQSTMGSIARVKMFYTDLAKWIAQQRDAVVYAAVLEGKDVRAMEKVNEGLIVIGNESKGISPSIMELVNVKINIPRKGKAESLNAAVAAGIILSHIKN